MYTHSPGQNVGVMSYATPGTDVFSNSIRCEIAYTILLCRMDYKPIKTAVLQMYINLTFLYSTTSMYNYSHPHSHTEDQ